MADRTEAAFFAMLAVASGGGFSWRGRSIGT